MTANGKKLAVLGFCALASIIVAFTVGVLFHATGASASDSVKIGGVVLGACIGTSIGVIALLTFKDDNTTTPPTRIQSGAPDCDHRVGQAPPETQPSSVERRVRTGG
ncbi:hypothetical protein ACIOWI_34705 [Streptomyces sp. NPDC087659]|uniref:hypothetical protein n=1 Tax=Streptomyces sp. NPDC087659 TaxID=3365801 RepID=UPI0037F73A49